MKVDIYNTDKKYNLITADPAWQYGSGGPRGGRFGKLDYSTMSTDDICALPVSELADKDCALELWFTASFVEDAIKVCKAWGFKVVRIDIVWEKLKESGARHAAVGPWGMSDAEFVLLGTKGKACSMQKVRNQYMIQKGVYTGKHSEKPEEILKLFDTRFGDVPRIELFAREHRDGWDCWGNEV
ncbi:MAG: MT-A70 family methyltransferase [Plesiomonas shigelloides]